jgi:hypothetical protein
MTHRFRIQSTVNTFFRGQHVHLAPQLFSTEDADLARFLRRYPNVTYLGSETSQPAPIQTGQYSPCPEPTQVVNGGLSAGRTAGVTKIKRQ